MQFGETKYTKYNYACLTNSFGFVSKRSNILIIQASKTDFNLLLQVCS